MFLAKKVGDFNKKESESLDFTGLKIPRDYAIKKGGYFVKKQMLKKVYAIVLAITLIGSQQCSSVLANDIAQIYSGVTQNTEIPDYDYWMAQTIMNGIDNNGNSLYSTFRSFSEPVYRQLGEYLLDDKPLVSISTAWSIYFNSEYRNQLTNMQKYVYEMLLMDYLKYDAFGEDKNKELTNSCLLYTSPSPRDTR